MSKQFKKGSGVSCSVLMNRQVVNEINVETDSFEIGNLQILLNCKEASIYLEVHMYLLQILSEIFKTKKDF